MDLIKSVQNLTNKYFRYYHFFSLFHESIKSQYEKSKANLRNILNDFTRNFDKHFFNEDWCKLNFSLCWPFSLGVSNFNSCTFRGYYIWPLDQKTYMYAMKSINTLMQEFPIQKIMVFYEEYFLYSDLPQDQVEVIHTYLFGVNIQRRDGAQVRSYC